MLGIDGGGTSCRAALATASGDIVGRGKSGAGQHPHRPDRRPREHRRGGAAGLSSTPARIPALIAATPTPCSGSPAANVGTYRQQLEAILPFAAAVVETDALIALEGALGDRRRGDCHRSAPAPPIMARKDGAAARRSAAGASMVGDQGSGARIGRDLLEETLLAHDGIRPASPLTDAMLARLPQRSARRGRVHHHGQARRFRRLRADGVRACRQGRCRRANGSSARAVGDVEASLDALDLRRQRSALPARRAGAALCAAAVARATGRC